MTGQRSFVSKVGRSLLKLFGSVFLICIALIALILVAVNTSPIQRSIAERASRMLSDMFEGTIHIRNIGRIGFSQVTGLDAIVEDPAGRRVLVVQGASVQMPWLGLVWETVVGGAEPSVIVIEQVSIDHAEIALVDAGENTPTLVAAFQPTQPAAEEPSETRVVLQHFELQHAWIHGSLEAVPHIDVEVRELKASFETGPRETQLSLDEAKLSARSLPGGIDASGRLAFEARLPEAEADPRLLGGSFQGEVAEIGFSLEAQVKGDRVQASLTAPAVSPGALARFVPQLAVQEPASLTAKVSGVLPSLDYRLQLKVGKARFQATGRVVIGEQIRMTADLDLEDLDLAKILPEAPRTELSATSKISASITPAGAVEAKYEVHLSPSRIDSRAIPKAQVKGELSYSEQGRLTAEGRVDLAEPGAETDVSYQLEADEGRVSVHAKVVSRLKQSERVRELLDGLSATGSLRADVRWSSDQNRLKADIEADLTDVRKDQVSAKRLELRGTAQGPLSELDLEVTGTARQIQADGREFERARFTARGTPEKLRVAADVQEGPGRRITLEAEVQPGERTVVTVPEIRITEPGTELRITADKLRFSGREVVIENLRVRGAGQAQVSLVWRDGLVSMNVTAEQLQLTRVFSALGIETPLEEALVTLRAEYQSAPRQEGYVKAQIGNIQAPLVQAGRLTADLSVAQGGLSGRVVAELGEWAQAELDLGDVGLSELMSVLTSAERQALAQLTGQVTLVGRAELRHLFGLLPDEALPFEQASGEVKVTLVASQEQGSAPRLVADIVTESLSLSGLRGDPEQAEVAKLLLEDVDYRLFALLDGVEHLAVVRAHAYDEGGDLLRVNAEADLPRGYLVSPGMWQRLPVDAPFDLNVEIPKREIQKLPLVSRMTDLDGYVNVDLTATGTIKSPKLKLAARLSELRSEEAGVKGLHAQATMSYASEGGSALVSAGSKAQSMLRLGATWQGDLLALRTAGVGQKSPIRGDLKARMHRFPLHLLPGLGTRQLRGHLNGQIQLSDFGTNPELFAELTAEELRLAGAPLNTMSLLISNKNNTLMADASIDSSGGGALTGSLRVPMHWGATVSPEFGAPVRANVVASDFRLGTFAPLVAGTVSGLEGRLDADLKAVLASEDTTFDGFAVVRDGEVQLPEIGQQFRDIEARLTTRRNRIVLQSMTARGITGRLQAEGYVQLDGTKLERASAEVHIDEDEKLPVTLEGAGFGDAWGDIELRFLAADGEANKLDINLARLYLTLPEFAPTTVQSLEPAEHIRVGVWQKGGEFRPIPLQPVESEPEEGPPLHIQVRLGEVWIEKMNQLRVKIDGKVRVIIDQEPLVYGRIELQRGTLDISGKTFEVERGAMTFDGSEPGNPTITALARWDSPAGYTVYAEYVGTVEQGDLKLRSDPPLNSNEIVNLLLFGAPEGSFASQGGGSAATALSIAGAATTRGLNRAISGLTDLDVSTRIDTSAGSPRPELVIRLSARVTTRVSYAVGEPSFGQSPDRTFVTVEFRLFRHWALAAMIGDRGASTLDLIWRRRY